MKSSTYRGAFGAIPERFCRYETAAIAILPVPYDNTSTWMKGANLGPDALIGASANMELYDIETDFEVYRCGIATMDAVACPDDPGAMVTAVYEAARRLVEDGKFVVGIGGEHSISVGIVRALSESFDDLSVLQLDAHADTRDSFEGSSYNHACVMSRIAESCACCIQAGLRSIDTSERKGLDRGRTFFAHEIIRDPSMICRIGESLTKNVYITIDLDVFDPSVMPSTGTPEPGGLDWYAVLDIIESVVGARNVVGFDVVELLPNPTNKAPDFMAAKLVYRILSMIFSRRSRP